MDMITILSPVHVGTGETIERPCFQRIGNTSTFNRYSFLEIIEKIPVTILMKDNLLKALSSSQNKKILYDEIKEYCKFNSIKPLYSVKYENEENRDLKYDVQEQIKTNGKPYIPGSSIKGALLNAWFYYELKKNYNESFIEKKLRNPKDSNNLLDFLECNLSDKDEIMKNLRSCLRCNDIFFNDIELYDATRIGSKNRSDIPLGIMECIKTNQIEENIIFEIDATKLSHLKKDFEKDYLLSRLAEDFDRDCIFRACNEYILDILQVELSNECMDLYDDNNCEQITDFNDDLCEQIIADKKANRKCCYIRIGESTSYFNKSIALLIKQKSPRIFEQYFDVAFSPSNRGKQKANPKTVPRTRVIYENDQQVVPAGYIKINYD